MLAIAWPCIWELCSCSRNSQGSLCGFHDLLGLLQVRKRLLLKNAMYSFGRLICNLGALTLHLRCRGTC